MPTGMGRPSDRTVQIIILLAQLLVLGFVGWVRAEISEAQDMIQTNDTRIRALETFTAAGNRWTREDHYLYESRVARELEQIRVDLALIKQRLGVSPKKTDNGRE